MNIQKTAIRQYLHLIQAQAIYQDKEVMVCFPDHSADFFCSEIRPHLLNSGQIKQTAYQIDEIGFFSRRPYALPCFKPVC